MKLRVRIADDGKVNPLGWKIDELVMMAHAVRDYLNVNRICDFTIFTCRSP